MFPGTKFDLAIALRDRISKLKPHYKPPDVTACIAEYWDHPDNVRAREQVTTKEEAGQYALELQASFSMPGGHADFESMWPSLIKGAAQDPLVLEALQSVVFAWLEQDTIPAPVRGVAARMIQGEFKPDKRKAPKGTPAAYAKNLQLALAVWTVHHVAGYKLSTNDTDIKNAFATVERATGIEYETVRDAWKKHHSRLPSQIES